MQFRNPSLQSAQCYESTLWHWGVLVSLLQGLPVRISKNLSCQERNMSKWKGELIKTWGDWSNFFSFYTHFSQLAHVQKCVHTLQERHHFLTHLVDNIKIRPHPESPQIHLSHQCWSLISIVEWKNISAPHIHWNTQLLQHFISCC